MSRDRREPIKLGLIGCGWVAENLHLPALQDLPDATVVAVADINTDRLKQVADRFHIKHRYTDFLTLLDGPGIDAIAVCVPAEFHVEVALAALDAGKHVLIEKPLALCLDESDRLIERAALSSSKVLLGFNMRWHRLVRQAQGIIERGTLGSLRSIRTVITGGPRHRGSVPGWTKKRELGGGVLFDQAVHHFDLWRFLLHSEVEEVFATTVSKQSDDETSAVTARMTNGVLAASIFLKGSSNNNEVEIYGQSGHLHLSCYRFDGLEFFSMASASGDARTRLRKMIHGLKELPRGLMNIRHGGEFMASYRVEWRHFIDAIRHDTAMGCTLGDGRRALQVVLAAAESASSGKPVKVAQAPRKITAIA